MDIEGWALSDSEPEVAPATPVVPATPEVPAPATPVVPAPSTPVVPAPATPVLVFPYRVPPIRQKSAADRRRKAFTDGFSSISERACAALSIGPLALAGRAHQQPQEAIVDDIAEEVDVVAIPSCSESSHVEECLAVNLPSIRRSSLSSVPQGAKVCEQLGVEQTVADAISFVSANIDEARIGKDAKKIVDDLTSRSGVWLSAGTISEHARRLEVKRDKLLEVAELQACTLYLTYIHCMRKALQQIVEEVKQRGGRLKTFYLFFRYDETPMKMTVLDTEILYGMSEDLANMLREYLPADHLVRDAGVVKLLQTEVTVAALTQVDNTYRLFSWTPALPIQAMSRPLLVYRTL